MSQSVDDAYRSGMQRVREQVGAMGCKDLIAKSPTAAAELRSIHIDVCHAMARAHAVHQVSGPVPTWLVEELEQIERRLREMLPQA